MCVKLENQGPAWSVDGYRTGRPSFFFVFFKSLYHRTVNIRFRSINALIRAIRSIVQRGVFVVVSNLMSKLRHHCCNINLLYAFVSAG